MWTTGVQGFDTLPYEVKLLEGNKLEGRFGWLEAVVCFKGFGFCLGICTDIARTSLSEADPAWNGF